MKQNRPKQPTLSAVIELRSYIGLVNTAIDMVEFSLRDVQHRAHDEAAGDVPRYVTARKRLIKNIASEYDLLHCYRLVRNRLVHDGNMTALESRLKKIRVEHQTTLHSDYPGLSAPNHIDQLTFDDFRIYARAVLRMAYWLNDAVELTADDLVNSEKSLGLERPELKRLKGRSRDVVEAKLTGRLSHRFDIDPTAVVRQAARHLTDLLLGKPVPARKRRKHQQR